MKFISTRKDPAETSFKDVIFRGLAPDGGLYLATEQPNLSDLISTFSGETEFSAMAAELTHALFPEDFTLEQATAIAKSAFTFSPRISRADGNIDLLELYHGPSCAFKDFGASFLAAVMEHFLFGENKRAIILTATSGDTGAAVAQAFFGKENIDVVVLYPGGRVSPGQERQLTTLGDNVHALEVRGSFDDCQRMVKEAFTNKNLKEEFPLTSANSINLGRLLPQSFYYIWASVQGRGSPIRFCVPSGNFGNLTAGALAKLWGMDAEGFIAATNANDVVPEYLEHGIYTPRPSIHTYANAMDVGNPSNFERLQTLFSHREMGDLISGFVVTDDEIIATMERYYKKQGVFICPHTACGILSSERYLKAHPGWNGRIISLSTAHPAKFTEVCQKACGKTPEVPAPLARAINGEKKSTIIGNQMRDLGIFLRETLGR